uniref:NAD(P)H dehydrogenase 18 n=1 Tax=Pelargonium exstipulatum TaxID=59873 RepID=A0A0F7GYV3_9ROSI
MAVCSSSSPSVISVNAAPSIANKIRVSNQKKTCSFGLQVHKISARNSTKLKAGLAEIEPDLNEDPIDRWAINSISPEDFAYGKYDGHHTYFEGDQEGGTFWEKLSDEYNGVAPPSGFQGLMSWLFLPSVAAGMYFRAPGEYLFLGAALFVIVFCIIEMDKPDQPHNFEPQIYLMERGARDKLINDYNTMSIWDFNDKYGELWDFTVPHDDLFPK